MLEENKERLSESDMAAVRGAIDRVNQAKAGDDPAAIQRAIDDLQRASQAMSEHLYAATGRGREPGGLQRTLGFVERGRAAAASRTKSSTSNSRKQNKSRN